MDLASVKVKQKLKNKELPTWMDKPPETDKRHDPVMVDENGQKKKITLKQTVLEDDYAGSESDSDDEEMLEGGFFSD